MVIQGIFPWCFTPEFYSGKPDHIDQLAAFVRGRPKEPLDAFMRESNAVIAYEIAPMQTVAEVLAFYIFPLIKVLEFCTSYGQPRWAPKCLQILKAKSAPVI
jgi:hypothetical protein